jgi:outer membrane receptor for ferrienterochelin and colicin
MSARGDAGLDTISLRNLGISRTLVLFDGQRVVSSNLLAGRRSDDLAGDIWSSGWMW